MEITPAALPRVTIQFCTQCKWMLRAAYFAQELLSTFSTSLGEVALQPSTGGIFVVKLYHASPASEGSPSPFQEHLLWDRKAEGGFPETKELKKRVRNIIDPTRDLGHVDGHKASATGQSSDAGASSSSTLQIDEMTPIPKAINKLQGTQSLGGELSGEALGGERKFTPMDVDPNSRRTSTAVPAPAPNQQEDEEIVGANGKIRIVGGDGDFGFCRPGDEDCG